MSPKNEVQRQYFRVPFSIIYNKTNAPGALLFKSPKIIFQRQNLGEKIGYIHGETLPPFPPKKKVEETFILKRGGANTFQSLN